MARREERWASSSPQQRSCCSCGTSAAQASAALAHFAAQLWDMWPKYSARPFTEGRYEGKGIGNNSATLDFAETCLKAFGADYRRSLIAQKLRDVRELLPQEEGQQESVVISMREIGG